MISPLKVLPLLLSVQAAMTYAAESGQKTGPERAEVAAPAANEEVRKFAEEFKGRGLQREGTPPTSAKEALKKFTLREGYEIELMASEPEVRQPLYMSWDSRGRMWVLEYLQYQFPAGLKVVRYDEHLRAQFDRMPEPPPKGEKGADQVSVFEDTTGSGAFNQHKVAISGLNIATAVIKGAGGIWVMNPPYLLFYPDRNDDDVPDSEPEVMLRGFGLEDTHAVANSLRWGPDGWLYGATGSTTTANVSSPVTKNIRFQGQYIWRFDPRSKVFEIYSEGGGNTFSTEIDSIGRVFSGTNSSDRGMHYDQGMSGTKAFGKHGPLLNPYAFGYFPHMETKSDGKRFSQAFAIYEGGLMPELSGRIIAANAMQNMCYVSRLIAKTSTFRCEDEPELLRSTDRWFRPVDVKTGPDGCIYFADWYDTRLSHVRPVDDWSKGDGRIYRVRPKGSAVGLKPFNLHTAPVDELIAYLGHANKWFRLQAGLELSWREEKSALPQLEKLARDRANPHALDALYALQMLGGLNDELAIDLLTHSDPYVRRWTVRCIGDRAQASQSVAMALRQLAAQEKQIEVRTQLLCSAKRLPARVGLGIVREMMERTEDREDARIPLLMWWAIESKSESDREAVLALFAEDHVWELPLAQTFGVQNLAKRYAMAGGSENYASCEKLLSQAKGALGRTLVIEGVAGAFEGGKIPSLPAGLSMALNDYMQSQMENDLGLAVKSGNAEGIKRALAIVGDKGAPRAKRTALIQALAEAGNPDALPVFLAILTTGDAGLKKVVLSVAGRYDDPRLAEAVIKGYEAGFAGELGLRDAAHRMLAGRKEWANLLLAAIGKHRIREEFVSADVVNQLGLYGDPSINELVKKYWPPASAKLANKQKLEEMNRLQSVIKGGSGDVGKGQLIFSQRCATCHTLFEAGGKIGPELTGYERQNLDFWSVAILDPSIEIREGFGAYVCKLTDGQVLMGLLDKQDAGGIVLKDLAGQPHSVKQTEIASLEASPLSVMPEGLLTGLSDADLRDFFSYLMKP